MKQSIAGDVLSEQVLSCLEEELQLKVTPRYKVSRKLTTKMSKPALSILKDVNGTPSYHKRAQLVE
jgi:hypothetical protein